MAANCSRCGATLTPGPPVCPACGAAVTAAAVYPPAVQNFAPPPSSGTSALKVVLIVVAIFVGLGIIAVGAFGFLAWRVSKSIHMSADGKQMTVNTPGGSFTTNTSKAFTAADLGTDIYPGATPGRGSMEMNVPGNSMEVGVFVTPDSKDQVVAFYKSRMGSEATFTDSERSATFKLTRSPSETVTVTIGARSAQADGNTRIAILHSKASKPSS